MPKIQRTPTSHFRFSVINMEIPGLELLLSSVSQSLRDRLDTLVAVTHWLIIKENLKCVKLVDGVS